VVSGKYDIAILALIDEFLSLVLTFWVNNIVDWFLMYLKLCFLKIICIQSPFFGSAFFFGGNLFLGPLKKIPPKFGKPLIITFRQNDQKKNSIISFVLVKVE
jgi:hypothetical protein